jgi:osmoprotectant transport system permease protein
MTAAAIASPGMSRIARAGLRVAVLFAALLAVIFLMPATAPLFHWLFPALATPVYQRASFLTLTLSHVALVAASSAIVVLAGMAIAIAVTRPSGRAFAGIVDTVTAVGQTFPPVAVLAIAVPMLGFGAAPTVVALVAYGILPVIDTTVAGLRSVRPSLLDAARGMGLDARQILFSAELPAAAPIILAGIRTSVAIGIGTATIGSTVGALTLGSPIIEGLSGSNTAYVIEGAIVVGLLAVTIDQAFAWLDLWLRRHQR